MSFRESANLTSLTLNPKPEQVDPDSVEGKGRDKSGGGVQHALDKAKDPA